MCSDSEKNMSAFADQNHAPSLTCVRLELIIPLEMEIFMLKQQQGYVLSKIGPHTYLLPYGQSIVLFKPFFMFSHIINGLANNFIQFKNCMHSKFFMKPLSTENTALVIL